MALATRTRQAFTIAVVLICLFAFDRCGNGNMMTNPLPTMTPMAAATPTPVQTPAGSSATYVYGHVVDAATGVPWATRMSSSSSGAAAEELLGLHRSRRSLRSSWLGPERGDVAVCHQGRLRREGEHDSPPGSGSFRNRRDEVPLDSRQDRIRRLSQALPARSALRAAPRARTSCPRRRCRPTPRRRSRRCRARPSERKRRSPRRSPRAPRPASSRSLVPKR